MAQFDPFLFFDPELPQGLLSNAKRTFELGTDVHLTFKSGYGKFILSGCIWRVAEAPESLMEDVNPDPISNEMVLFGGVKQADLSRDASHHGSGQVSGNEGSVHGRHLIQIGMRCVTELMRACSCRR